jgi:hypothetical protein
MTTAVGSVRHSKGTSYCKISLFIHANFLQPGSYNISGIQLFGIPAGEDEHGHYFETTERPLIGSKVVQESEGFKQILKHERVPVFQYL